MIDPGDSDRAVVLMVVDWPPLPPLLLVLRPGAAGAAESAPSSILISLPWRELGGGGFFRAADADVDVDVGVGCSDPPAPPGDSGDEGSNTFRRSSGCWCCCCCCSSGSDISCDVRGVSWMASNMDWRDTELVSVLLAPSWSRGGCKGGTVVAAVPDDDDDDAGWAWPGMLAYPVKRSLLKESTSSEPFAALAANVSVSCACACPCLVCSKSCNVRANGFAGGVLGNGRSRLLLPSVSDTVLSNGSTSSSSRPLK